MVRHFRPERLRRSAVPISENGPEYERFSIVPHDRLLSARDVLKGTATTSPFH
jgi:hypothetical protein